MKYAFVALAALATGVAARGGHGHHHRRHANPIVPDNSEECAPPLVPKPCTTYVTSYLVPYTPLAPVEAHTAPPVLVETHPTPAQEYPVETPTTTDEVVYVTQEVHPTPIVTTCSTTGVYTFPATTITLTSTEVVCVPTATKLPPGEHTYGGVTTVVETQTTVVCPVPTIVTEDGKITSKVTTTTFVCPTPGTYTIGPLTTTLTETVDCEYPVITEYAPGTYTQPEFTTTITETQQVITCPAFETSTQYIVPVAGETSVPVPEPQPESPSYETPEVPKTPEYPEEEEEEVEKPEPTESEKPVETKPVTVVPVGGSGDKWAITYSPYNDNQQCKDAASVDADIKDIKGKGFQAIRLYSSDCNGLETVGNACVKHGLKIIAGVFIKAGDNCQADSQIADWIKWGHLDIIPIFTIANEALFQGFCTANQLASYIAKAKGQLRAAGFNGMITTAEPLNILNQHYQVLCPQMDCIGLNSHGFFNPNIAAEQAGDFVNSQMADAAKLCNKPVYILETGWPDKGQSNGKAIASPEAQAAAFKSIKDKCPMSQIVVFTYRNDYWKDPGPLGVEQNFGCAKYFE